MPRRVDPYRNFTFRITLGDVMVAGFQSMSVVAKLSGLNKSTDVTLKRGLIAAPALQDWLNQGKRKRMVTIELRNDAQSVTARWILRGTRLVKVNSDPLNATGNDVPIETLVLSADRLEFASPAV
ncbi:MAG TPA: phage tail protein [Thermoanaerobaculia bacterium]|nr:phage tail protein [Thermoanaerobaculia bacterium]